MVLRKGRCLIRTHYGWSILWMDPVDESCGWMVIRWRTDERETKVSRTRMIPSVHLFLKPKNPGAPRTLQVKTLRICPASIRDQLISSVRVYVSISGEVTPSPSPWYEQVIKKEENRWRSEEESRHCVKAGSVLHFSSNGIQRFDALAREQIQQAGGAIGPPDGSKAWLYQRADPGLGAEPSFNGCNTRSTSGAEKNYCARSVAPSGPRLRRSLSKKRAKLLLGFSRPHSTVSVVVLYDNLTKKILAQKLISNREVFLLDMLICGRGMK